MKQTVKEAAIKHQNGFPTCEDASVLGAFSNGMHHQSYKSFIAGAKWQAKQSPWISVEESLPKNDENHFFINCRSNAVGTAYYENGNWYSSYSGEVIYGITHYMPIPSFDEILEANKDVLQRLK